MLNFDITAGLCKFNQDTVDYKNNFKVSVPVIEEVKEVTDSAKPSNCECAPILIVDDNVINIFAIRSMIEIRYKMPMDEATNGKNAVEMYEKSQKRTCCGCYRIIFMDFNMPVMDGVSASMKINKVKEENAITDIYGVTAYNDQENFGKGIKSGMTAVITKPIDVKNLLDLFEKDKDVYDR